MREIDSKNQIWFMKDGGVTKIGLTKSFLDSLDGCWQIMPANMVVFKKKAPLLTVETNDTLISIMSPVAGNMLHFNEDALDFPDQLEEDTIILELHDGEVPERGAPAPAINVDWAMQQERARQNLINQGVVPPDWAFNQMPIRPARGAGLAEIRGNPVRINYGDAEEQF